MFNFKTGLRIPPSAMLDSTGVLTDVGSWVGQSASSQSVDEQVVEHIEETVLVFAGDSIMGMSGAIGRLEKRVIDRSVVRLSGMK